jgi:hypothetical protein
MIPPPNMAATAANVTADAKLAAGPKIAAMP